MKKLFVLLVVGFLFFGASEVWAQSFWFYANQKELGWDAVTQLEDGRVIPAGDLVQYSVYRCLLPDVGKLNAVKLGSTSDVKYLLTFIEEGRFIVGVAAERVQGGEVVSSSKIAWSDDPNFAFQGRTFGVIYFISPKTTGGLRVPTPTI